MIPKLDEYKKRVKITSDDEIKPGLAAIEKAMELLGSPQQNLKAIHVAGTNGKGSTICFMESILREAGISTGVFASPAMIDIHDQIRINGENITEEELTASFQTLKDSGIDGMLTDFELLTAAAFVTFDRLKPDVVLIECGMGGRFDSTNVITPTVSVIPSIAKDHVGFLGDSIEEIAWHKTGIFKKGVPAVCGQIPYEAKKVTEKVAKEVDSPLLIYGQDFQMIEGNPEQFRGSLQITLPPRKMKGPHQAINAAVAIEALIMAELKLPIEAIQSGIACAKLSYRFEEVAPGVFFDGAHNPAAAAMLRRTVQEQFPGEKIDFVIGMMANKEIKETLNELIPVAHSFTFIDFDVPGAATAQFVYDQCDFGKKQVTDRENVSIILSKDLDGKKIVSGSLYLLNSLRSHIL
ncbi:bifunctional folylpolyglutamate synthase/dihydrofolate synthase [Sporosarcina sp. BI001-red]|uniref:bifunctional folylpolyglutamate synthase/dihydrofolate synthase n=1 Tax=Sporosarcina sp. BI001-red TaxID=2282866 RepID=UPI000E227F8E|nr:folylpolyglutamate synthase/dihydrofolate synthase family protein [Sporosarcina sp. BI001-red]REB07162.1 bifunctional folylpolyglutamate synthase/dihydrofolate synthase [Sporosarcina sp. BI001-red]